MSWYRVEISHTCGGYYRDCGLLHATVLDEHRVWTILRSPTFQEWKVTRFPEVEKKTLLIEKKLELSLQDEKIFRQITKQVLQEGGGLLEERLQAAYAKQMETEKLAAVSSGGSDGWIKVGKGRKRGK